MAAFQEKGCPQNLSDGDQGREADPAAAPCLAVHFGGGDVDVLIGLLEDGRHRGQATIAVGALQYELHGATLDACGFVTIFATAMSAMRRQSVSPRKAQAAP